MKQVDKLKRKIKRTKWMIKHFNKVILGVGIPATFIGQFGMIISPFVSLISMLIAFLTYTVGGMLWISRYEDTDYLNLLERELYYAEHTSEESVEMLNKTIADLQQNPTKVKDKQTTKRLIKELIKINKSAQTALQEQKEAAEYDAVAEI